MRYCNRLPNTTIHHALCSNRAPLGIYLHAAWLIADGRWVSPSFSALTRGDSAAQHVRLPACPGTLVVRELARCLPCQLPTVHASSPCLPASSRADRLNAFLEYAMSHDNVFLVTVSQASWKASCRMPAVLCGALH